VGNSEEIGGDYGSDLVADWDAGGADVAVGCCYFCDVGAEAHDGGGESISVMRGVGLLLMTNDK
jgi:hypothetical protein